MTKGPIGLRYDVVRLCAQELLWFASTGDTENTNPTDLLRARVPSVTPAEMQAAIEVALECTLGVDYDPEDEADEEAAEEDVAQAAPPVWKRRRVLH